MSWKKLYLSKIKVNTELYIEFIVEIYIVKVKSCKGNPKPNFFRSYFSDGGIIAE